MERIYLKKYKNPNEIKVYHPFNKQLFLKMQNLENAKWNQIDKAWTLPKKATTWPLLFKNFRGITWIDMRELKSPVKGRSTGMT